MNEDWRMDVNEEAGMASFAIRTRTIRRSSLREVMGEKKLISRLSDVDSALVDCQSKPTSQTSNRSNN